MASAPENWETIKALFVEALELNSAERSAFLLKICPDPVVRVEVERLLSEYTQSKSFLSNPILGGVKQEVEAKNRQFRTGELLAGRFKIVRFIAAGGMGEVYEAEDLELREHVAIKTIHADIVREPNATSRFKREIHLARKVTHPNVCRIFDLFRHAPSQGGEETLFVSMELLQGKTLAEHLEVVRRIPTQDALPLVTQMASALSAAHDVGIVHRDFKPGNVVLVAPKREGDKVRLVVTDFGLAARSLSLAADSATTLTTIHNYGGTPAYMAPEQIEGHPATAATDIYALGLVVYEMVTGQRPFRGDTPMSTALKRLSEDPTPPRALVPELSTAWETLILRCLEREPSKRYARAQEISAALIAVVFAKPDGVSFSNDGTVKLQERILEAAAPRESPVGRSIEVVAMVRRAHSGGLREYLNREVPSTITSEDVREKPFELEFVADAQGKLQAMEICLRLDSPDFQPPSQTKKLRIPPLGDSPLCTFLIKPNFAGELLANLELLKGEEIVASRRITTCAVAEGSPVGPEVSIVSIPITIVVHGALITVLSAPLTMVSRQPPEAPRELSGTNPESGTTRLLVPQIPTSKRKVSDTPRAPTTSSLQSRRGLIAAACFTIVFVIAFLANITYQRFHHHSSDRPRENKIEQTGTTLSYQIIAQNYREGRPDGEPYRVSEHHVFVANSGIHFVFNVRQPGHLYILNEGPSSTDEHPVIISLFPSPATNAGSAEIPPDRDFTIPAGRPLVFRNRRGTEKLWLVWSRERVPELDALDKWANFKDRGKIGDVAQAQRIQSFLTKSKSFPVESSGDEKTPATTLSGNGEILVHLVTLDHE